VSWSITVNDLQQVTDGLPDYMLKAIAIDNPAYEADAGLAFECAQAAGLVSATLSGGRTPSPYGGPDTVVISVIGFSDRRQAHAVPPQFPDEASRPPLSPEYPFDDEYDDDYSFYETMAQTILTGPDKEADDAGSGAVRLPDPPGGAGGSVGD